MYEEIENQLIEIRNKLPLVSPKMKTQKKEIKKLPIETINKIMMTKEAVASCELDRGQTCTFEERKNKIEEKLDWNKIVKDKFDFQGILKDMQRNVDYAYEKGKSDERKMILDIIEKRIDACKGNIKLFPREDDKYEEFVCRLAELKQEINNPDERVRLALSHKNALEEENGK